MCAIGQAPRVLGPFTLLFSVKYCTVVEQTPILFGIVIVTGFFCMLSLVFVVEL